MIAVEVSLRIVEGVLRLLVPVELENYPIYGLHELEKVVVPPNPLVFFVSL